MKHVSHYGRLDRDSQKVLVDGVSRREILRQTGMHRKTLKKILEHSSPPGYRQQKPRTKKKLGAFLERIRQILKDDQAMPRKQRHTAKRIWERLREDGFTGGYPASGFQCLRCRTCRRVCGGRGCNDVS
jgi:transposase